MKANLCTYCAEPLTRSEDGTLQGPDGASYCTGAPTSAPSHALPPFPVRLRYEHGRKLPALSVKVRNFRMTAETVATVAEEFEPDPGFTLEWAERYEHERAEEFAYVYGAVCEDLFEFGEERAREAFQPLGYDVKVWSSGRSSGWIVLDGLPDVEDWSPELRAAWEQFAKECEETLADIPYRVVWSLRANVWETEKEAERVEALAGWTPTADSLPELERPCGAEPVAQWGGERESETVLVLDSNTGRVELAKLRSQDIDNMPPRFWLRDRPEFGALEGVSHWRALPQLPSNTASA